MSLSVTKPDTADLIRAVEDLRTASMDLSSAYLKETHSTERQNSILNEIKEIQAAIEVFIKTLEKKGDESYQKLIQSYGDKLKEIHHYLESLAELEKIEKIISGMQMPEDFTHEIKKLLDDLKKLCKEYTDINHKLVRLNKEIAEQEKYLQVINILIGNNPKSENSRKNDYINNELGDELRKFAIEKNLLNFSSYDDLYKRRTEAEEHNQKLNDKKDDLELMKNNIFEEMGKVKKEFNKMSNLSDEIKQEFQNSNIKPFSDFLESFEDNGKFDLDVKSAKLR